ncbi:MAG: lysylphosphatidylglycerol synthase transmembrane domain-containing protein [Bacteriovorax sp.]|nr:lysylphosphatidylglycerol synthase transmembrane domain-containing protein [Bacteriovorax sp.]
MIKSLLKFAVAFALLYWLIASGKLDLSLVRKSFEVGPQWIIAFFLVIIQVALGTYRYKILLETKSQKPLNFFEVLKLNYIGLFFSSVLPGAVTGDLIKLVYVKKLDQNFTKTFLVTVTLLDRIVGLAGLLFLSGCFSLIYYSEVSSLSPKITQVILLNLFLFAGSTLFLGTLISPYKFQKIIVKLVKKLPLVGKKIAKLFDQLFSLRENRKDILSCFVLSIFIQFLAILAFWTISSPFYSGHLPLQYAFTFIPVGLIATAIPISPGGLGVGHVLFSNLFSFVKIDNGASLFNLFFLCNFSHNILGVLPYLLVGRKTVKEKEALRS